VGHFNRPGARFTRKRFYVCDFGATKDAMSGSKMSMRVLLLRGIPAWSLPGVFLFAAILLVASTIRDRHVP
jgi:hypothetical protein